MGLILIYTQKQGLLTFYGTTIITARPADIQREQQGVSNRCLHIRNCSTQHKQCHYVCKLKQLWQPHCVFGSQNFSRWGTARSKVYSTCFWQTLEVGFLFNTTSRCSDSTNCNRNHLRPKMAQYPSHRPWTYLSKVNKPGSVNELSYHTSKRPQVVHSDQNAKNVT